jgi:CRP-like cAMP-binding protein
VQRSASVEASEASIIARLPQRRFLALMEENPAFAIAVARQLAGHVRRLAKPMLRRSQQDQTTQSRYKGEDPTKLGEVTECGLRHQPGLPLISPLRAATGPFFSR